MAAEANPEISALIAVLHDTSQRLEELTAGEVDAVADSDGRAFLLRRPQEQLRHIEAAKQAAILNALSANIALLDSRGLIISVNEGWRRFSAPNGEQGAGHPMGVNYLDICDSARGEGSSDAHAAAAGVRSVLAGEARRFEIDYSCDSGTNQRWFQLTVTPLADARPSGAVVMHLDVTAERQIRQKLHASESGFRQVAENIRDVFYLVDADSGRTLYISPAYEEILGLSCASAYVNPDSWTEAIHPDDRVATCDKHKKGMAAGKFEYEYRIVRPDGSVRWLQARGFPVRDDAGKTVRIAGVTVDITERKRIADELRESDRRFSDMLGNVELLSVMIDREMRLTYCNDYFLGLTGWRREEVLGGSFIELFIPPDRVEALRTFKLALLANVPASWHHENEILTRSGERRLIRWNNSVLRSGAGDVIGTASIGEDITEQKRADFRIKRLNRMYAVLSQTNALTARARSREELLEETCRIAVEAGAFKMAWIGVIDPKTRDGKVVARFGGEEGYVETAGLTAHEGTIDSERPASRALRQVQPVISNDIATDPSMVLVREELLRRGHKSAGYFTLTVAGRTEAVIALFAGERGAFDDEETRLLLELASDISVGLAHIEKQEQLEYLAYYDALTGLANRRLFLERVGQFMRSAVNAHHELAVLLIDLERFKNINDGLGRPAGDALLKLVAAWLTQNLGDVSLLARVGADQFAVVLPDVMQESDVTQMLGKTMDALLQHPFRLNDAVFRIAAKVGVALFPDHGNTADTLFRNAEAALKKAKARGDRYLFYTQSMTEAVAERLTLESQLRQALDNGEFVLHYQPIMTLTTGRLTSAEALIRWNDPRTGLVAPGRFIPVLEETGLIYDVGRWALRQAIADYLHWRRAGLAALRVAVNVSPLQVRHRGFIAEIEQAIAIDPHAAAGLELELTENLIMEDVKNSIASLRAIRGMGVQIAIDDFGTGFSSLSYLSKLPVDTLKIDRSFVIDMTVTPEGLALVSTIINLAHSMKLNVVAEGVETGEQARLLRLLNCDEMQGYLLGKPVARETFETMYLTAAAANIVVPK